MSSNFEDNKGTGWSCRIDWGAMRRASAAGVDLSKVEEHLGDFYRGSHSLMDALWAVVGPDADKRKIERDAFEEEITGEAIERAVAALLEGLQEFFPSMRASLIREADAEVRRELAGLSELLAKSSTESQAS